MALTLSPFADQALYARHWGLYAPPDVACAGWQDRTDILEAGDVCYAAFTEDGRLAGGITDRGGVLCFPFLAVPFTDRAAFWQCVLARWAPGQGQAPLALWHIHEADTQVLLALGARKRWAQQRMAAPARPCDAVPADGFRLDTPSAGDLNAAIEVTLAAHTHGYTATVYGRPARADVAEALRRRFSLFAATGTLHFGVIAREAASGEPAGVCIAGIYPDARERFATVHQLSVAPPLQGRGLGRAMLLHALHAAFQHTSPVVTLQVLLGNPAECLYRSLGFVPGPAFSDLTYTPS